MKIEYHSWLAHKAGCCSEEKDVPEKISTITGLMDWLEEQDSSYKEMFSNRNVIYASVNGEIADHESDIGKLKSISFFSPIAGG